MNKLLLEYEHEDVCSGLIFRCRINRFINKRGEYVETIRMIPLKRKSCSGCDQCGWLMEFLSEDISHEIGSPIAGNIEDNALYQYTVTYSSRDWESGIVDDFECGFVKIDT